MFLSGLICLTVVLNCGVVKSANNVGLNWRELTENPMIQMATGQAGVWGVTSASKMVYREGTYNRDGTEGDSWTQIDSAHNYYRIDVGTNIVWAVSTGAKMLIRTGITSVNPVGCGWTEIDTDDVHMLTVSVSRENHVWATTNAHGVWRRLGTSLTNPVGDGWTAVPGSLKSISVGPSGVWGLDRYDKIWYRNGTFGNINTSGSGWIQVHGKLRSISSGNGVVYGVAENKTIFKRSGITAVNPTGLSWVVVQGSGKLIEVGDNTVWLCDFNNRAWVKTIN